MSTYSQVMTIIFKKWGILMSSHAASVKKGVNIELVSIVWMGVEAAVAISSGILAHSLSLIAFGADSVIELIASAVLLWRLAIEARGKEDACGCVH